MRTLFLKPRKLTPKILSFLADRRLIMPLAPTRNVSECRSRKGAVGLLYKSDPAHGSHKLISICATTGPVKLNSHADNEEFILINPDSGSFRPMYMIIGLYKRHVIERKAAAGRLKEKDFLALELVFNDPRVSIFTMLKGTPHFEITAGGKKKQPVFFVTEPSDLELDYLDLKDYEVEVNGRRQIR